MKIANLPDGWTQRDGAAYAGVTLSFSEGNTVFAEPGSADAPVEFGGDVYTIAEAEELIQRLSEAVAICKAAAK